MSCNASVLLLNFKFKYYIFIQISRVIIRILVLVKGSLNTNSLHVVYIIFVGLRLGFGMYEVHIRKARHS